MIAHELSAAARKPFYAYVSVERSDRTGGQAWTEHVVETSVGRVRFLMAVNGEPLSGERMGEERGRLAEDLAHPEEFEKREQSEKDDEAHARQMMELLPKAFVLSEAKVQGPDWRIDFSPDPRYSASGTEAKVLHGMTGSLLIDRKDLRLHHVEGRLLTDESLDLGLLNVRAGSNFETDKEVVDGYWRTLHVLSDIHAKAVLLKSIARNQEVTRSHFHEMPAQTSLAEGIALAEEPPAP